MKLEIDQPLPRLSLPILVQISPRWVALTTYFGHQEHKEGPQLPTVLPQFSYVIAWKLVHFNIHPAHMPYMTQIASQLLATQIEVGLAEQQVLTQQRTPSSKTLNLFLSSILSCIFLILFSFQKNEYCRLFKGSRIRWRSGIISYQYARGQQFKIVLMQPLLCQLRVGSNIFWGFICSICAKSATP